MARSEKPLEGLRCTYDLYIADSEIPGAGSGLFVRKEVPAGNEIFRVSVPAVSVVISDIDGCDSCFAWMGSKDPFIAPVKLLTCASCQTVKYCSKECQRNAWRRYHREECKAYCEINAHGSKLRQFDLATRMLVRLVILHDQGQITDNQWQAILALKSHKESIDRNLRATIQADVRLMKEMTKDERPEDDLEDLYWRIRFNQHSVDSPMQPQLGSCLVPAAALINHSCRPNAHHLSEGPELVLRSYRKIAKNEEITITYIDPSRLFEERQEALSMGYAFNCQCARCANGSEMQKEMLTGDPILDEHVYVARSQLDALKKASADPDQEVIGLEAKIRQAFRSLTSRTPWPVSFPPIPTIHLNLANRFENEQRWEKALYYWLKIVYVIDPLLYPDRLAMQRVDDLMSLSQLEVWVPNSALLAGNRHDRDELTSMASSSRILHTIETESTVRASFHSIESSLSLANWSHNTNLKDDAAASLGPNHLISRIAAHLVKDHDRRVMTKLGMAESAWQSETVKEMIAKKFKVAERDLLEWAGVDVSVKTV